MATEFKKYFLNIHGSLYELDSPKVMGILNVTPDSFYSGSRCSTDDALIERRVHQIIDEGADMIDIGGYSSRPNADDISPEEEYARLDRGLRIIRSIAPDAIVSVDTFRADVARRCVENWGVEIVNDISGGDLDNAMFETVAALKVPYILMHMRGTPATMNTLTQYDKVVVDVIKDLGAKVQRLNALGVADVIIDPGFGFSKTIEQNYRLMKHLALFHSLALPLLVGISRKSMIYRPLGITPEQSLNGTTALNMVALAAGAHILRVHDVKEACEAVKIHNLIKSQD